MNFPRSKLRGIGEQEGFGAAASCGESPDPLVIEITRGRESAAAEGLRREAAINSLRCSQFSERSENSVKGLPIIVKTRTLVKILRTPARVLKARKNKSANEFSGGAVLEWAEQLQ